MPAACPGTEDAAELAQSSNNIWQELEEDPGVDGVVDRERIGELRHVPFAPLDRDALFPGVAASPAEHLRRKIDPSDFRPARGEGDGELPAAAAGIEDARPRLQAQRVPDAVEVGRAVGRQHVRLSAGVPAFGPGVPGSAGTLQPGGAVGGEEIAIGQDGRREALALAGSRLRLAVALNDRVIRQSEFPVHRGFPCRGAPCVIGAARATIRA